MPHRSLREIPSALILLVLALLLLTAASAASAQTITGSPDLPIQVDPFVCLPDEHTLCLVGGRFSVRADFQLTPSGPSFEANAVPFSDNSGYFWFFDTSNVELVVKVLNACVEPFNSYWVFAAGMTNVDVVLTVTDSRSGQMRRYENPLGMAFAPIQDTSAFATCP